MWIVLVATRLYTSEAEFWANYFYIKRLTNILLGNFSSKMVVK